MLACAGFRPHAGLCRPLLTSGSLTKTCHRPGRMRGQGVDSRTPVGTLRPIGDRLQGKPCGGLLSCRCPPAVALHELEAGGEPREAAHRDLRRPAEALVGNDRGIRSVLGAALGLLPRVIAVLAQTDPAQLARCKRQQALERPIGDSASPGCRRSAPRTGREARSGPHSCLSAPVSRGIAGRCAVRRAWEAQRARRRSAGVRDVRVA